MNKLTQERPDKQNDVKIDAKNFYYTYSYLEEEDSLCALEMRAFFGKDSESNILESSIKVDPNRSPFIKERVDVIYEGNSLEDIKEKIKGLEFTNSTFKVIFVKDPDHNEDERVRFKERRRIEREIGLLISGEPDLLKPDILLGIIKVGDGWVFGRYHKNKHIWLNHKKKPHSYSTALSARMARAIVNIAAPHPEGIKVIDPCCGIGTVLVEGLSMGIDIVGSDVNPLVLPGARENIAHFGLKAEVIKRDIIDINDNYDVAIIDLPYNLCSVITSEEQLEMLQSTRQFAKKAVIITIESIDSIIRDAGFDIVDRCDIRKGKLIRHVMVCE